MVHLLRPVSWPVRRKPLLILSLKRLTTSTEKSQAQHVTLSNLHQDHLRPSHEKIPVKLFDCWTCGQKGHYSGDCPSNTNRKSLLSKNKPFRSLLAKQAFSPAQTQAAIRIMDTYYQFVCHNCLVHGCRGHADDREIHEAIPEVMAVLHKNPD
jgi:hypothetical protein